MFCAYRLRSALQIGVSCIQDVFVECGSHLPTQARQGLQILASSVSFLCVEEFERQWCTHYVVSCRIMQFLILSFGDNSRSV